MLVEAIDHILGSFAQDVKMHQTNWIVVVLVFGLMEDE
jgi:hypothetical protein